MKLEIINNVRVITPETDMWLCNAEQRIISDKVYLGINANENDWHDIAEEEKEALEILWEEEVLTEDSSEIEQKALAYDILMGVSE